MNNQNGAIRVFSIGLISMLVCGSLLSGQAQSAAAGRSSLICGYIRDQVTNDPVQGAQIEIYWQAEEDSGWEYVYTDNQGYYSYSISNVEIRLYASADGYFSNHTGYYDIGDDDTFWWNATLTPYPPITVMILGYITDNQTGVPIPGANLEAEWTDTQHYWYNNTETNASGFYQVGLFAGLTYLYANKNNYFSFDSPIFFTENDSIVWYNITLIPYPPITSFFLGYITDNMTGDALSHVYISINVNTEQGSWYNSTYSDENGYFRIGTLPGHVQLYLSKSDYKYKYYHFDIGDNQTLWENLTLLFQPEPTAIVQGYVIDGESNAVIHHAYVHYDWRDETGHFFSNATFTDQRGYYRLDVPDGAIEVTASANGYTSALSPWMQIGEEDDLWINATLTPEIKITIIQPTPGIYYLDAPLPFNKVLSVFAPWFKPIIIIGPIIIKVNLTNSTLGCNRMEFYFDDTHIGTAKQAPYECLWNQKTFGRHTLKVVAYDNAGPCTVKTMTVRKFL